jgi:hypothetical protein
MKLNIERANRLKDVAKQVAEINNISFENLLSHSRKFELVRLRAMAFNVLYMKHNAKLTEIGRIFKRHHSTIIHGLKTHNSFMETDASYLSDYMLTLAQVEEKKQVTSRDKAIEVLQEIESFTTIGKKIMYVEKLIESYEHKSINCENESQS